MTSDQPPATPPSAPTAPVPPDAPIMTSIDRGVCTITLNRPSALNSFNAPLKRTMLTAIRRASTDDAVRAVVLTGAGTAFCAGQDLKEHLDRVRSGDPEIGRTISEFYTPLATAITSMPKPVLAAVGGVAAGAGVALAMACDMRIAAESASFSMAFAQVALSADTGASFTLPRLIGTGRAMRMMMLGEKVPAAEALRIGLVDEVVPDSDFAERVSELAGRLAEGPTAAFGWIKASLRFGVTHDLAETLAFEDRAQQACFNSPDHREALDAFVAKRAPRFGHVS